MERRSGFSWGYFILGIFFIAAAIIAFCDPVGDLVGVVYFFSFLVIFKGLFELFFKQNYHDASGKNRSALIIVGIFDIIIGVFLLFNIVYAMIALPFLFAIWIIGDSIFGIFSAGIYVSENTGYYWFNLILCFIMLIVGILLLFNPIVSALTLAFIVGFYLLLSGIFLIVYAFNY